MFRVAFGFDDVPMFTNPHPTLEETYPEKYVIESQGIPVVRIERLNGDEWETFTGADNVVSMHPKEKEETA